MGFFCHGILPPFLLGIILTATDGNRLMSDSEQDFFQHVGAHIPTAEALVLFSLTIYHMTAFSLLHVSDQ